MHQGSVITEKSPVKGGEISDNDVEVEAGDGKDDEDEDLHCGLDPDFRALGPGHGGGWADWQELITDRTVECASQHPV